MFEKRFAAVSPQAFTADGTANGLITIVNATLFKVKQQIFVNATGQPQLQLEVKSIPSPTTMVVGPRGGNINQTINISAYTVVAGANVFADIQKRPDIDFAEIMRAVYDEEPAVALRSLLVDKMGNDIDTTVDSSGKNRLAVDSEVTVNTVQLFTLPFDTISAAYPTSSQEVYTSYLGGLSGTLQQTVTVNYTDSTKNLIQNVLRTPVG